MMNPRLDEDKDKEEEIDVRDELFLLLFLFPESHDDYYDRLLEVIGRIYGINKENV